MEEVGMTRRNPIRIACVALFAVSVAGAITLGAAGFQSSAASTAAKASPDLVGALSKELGSSPDQAAGAAGALFGLAKSRLKGDEFTPIGQAVPGMDLLLKAAPAAGAGN